MIDQQEWCERCQRWVPKAPDRAEVFHVTGDPRHFVLDFVANRSYKW